MPKSVNSTILSRRNALLLAATALGRHGRTIGHASDSIKTGAHQESGKLLHSAFRCCENTVWQGARIPG